MTNMSFIIAIVVQLMLSASLSAAYDVVYAINAGGDSMTDSNGIFFESDLHDGKTGTASDFGKQMQIGRVVEEDQLLYQTERYHTESFYYDIPIPGDGVYALVLKFSEVYFDSAHMKVFDVVLNSAHTIVDKLDIFKLVGKGNAHDEIVYFSASRGWLQYDKEESRIRNGKVRVEFAKTSYDNPKVNAIILFKGENKNDLEDIPRLPPAEEYFDNVFKDKEAFEPDEEFIAREETPKIRKTSGPKQQDPYTLDDSSTMLPIFIALGAFVPLLFCLCKM